MIKYMKNKKVIMVFFYTFFLFVTCSLFTVNFSGAKFKDDEEYAVVYNSNLSQIYYDEQFVSYHENISNQEYLYAIVDVKPNPGRGDGSSYSKDNYTITVSEGCTIKTRESTNYLNSNTITVNLKGKTTTQFLDVKCSVDNPNIIYNKVYWRIQAKIEEQIDNEPKFLYRKGFVTIESLPKEPEEETPKITKTISKSIGNPYQELVKWLEAYLSKYYDEAGNEDYPYIRKAILGNSTDDGYITKYKNNQFDSGVLGLKITETEDSYTFQIEENFIGYARTWENFHYNTGLKYLYFNEEPDNLLNSAHIKNIFVNYLKEYVYKNDLGTFELVKQYIDENEFDISGFVLNGTPSIEGLVRNLVGTTPAIRVSSSFLKNATDYFDQPISVLVDDNVLTTLESKIKNNPVYYHRVTDSMIQEMKKDSAFLQALENTEIINYFSYYDKEKGYVGVSISPSKTLNQKDIAITSLDFLKNVSDFKLENLSDEVLSITLTIPNENESEDDTLMMNVVSSLDTYFKVSSSIHKEEGKTTYGTIPSEIVVEQKNGRLISLTYHIVKNV